MTPAAARVASGPGAEASAALVDGVAVTVGRVDARIASMRAGPYGGRLAHPGSKEGRQLRRWVVQLTAAEVLLEVEATKRGLDPGGPAVPSANEVVPDRQAALELGHVAAAVLGTSAAARAVYQDLTAAVVVPDSAVGDYYGRNPDLFVERPCAPGCEGRSRPLPEVAEAIRADLLGVRRRQLFSRWLAARTAESVRVTPGFEHPGDPGQPDNTHRH